MTAFIRKFVTPPTFSDSERTRRAQLTYAITGVIALAFAMLTAGYQAVRAAMANPVDSLRCE